MTQPNIPSGMKVLGHITPEYAQILTVGALASLAKLHRNFNTRRLELLERRALRQKELDSGKLPDFLPETKHVREADWQVAPVPRDLQDRRVEITGPTDRKMVINALNSGANMFMADFEDSSTPTWDNQLQGQINVRDAITVRLRPVLLPQRQGPDQGELGRVSLPAENGIASRGETVERRLRVRAEGTRCSTRLGKSHGTDRNHSRHL